MLFRSSTVRSLVVKKHTEWLAFIALVFNPVDSLIGNNISGITFYLYSFAIHLDEGRVIVVALSRKDFPMVKALRVANQMPFTNHGCLVSILLEKLRERQLVTVEGG